MRFLLRSLFTLATLAVLAAGAIAFLVPTELVRDQAIALVEEKTGRQLEVRGDTSFTFYPAIGVALNDVTLSNPPSMGGGPMLRMDSLTVDLKLVPLLSRSVEVERFVLVRPIFDLRIDARGNRNWDFAQPQAALPSGPAGVFAGQSEQGKQVSKPRVMQAQAGGLGGGLVQDIRLGTVRIQDGKVVYANAINGASHRIDALNVSLRQSQLSEPLDAEGNFVWRGEKIEFAGRAGTPLALVRGGASAITVDIKSAPAKGSFKGQLAMGDSLSAEGDFSADTPSVRGLSGWAATPLPHGKGLGPARISTRLKYQGSVLSFTDSSFSLDGMNGRGNGSVSLKGSRPYIRAALALDKLDLNAWIGEAGPAPQPRPRAAPAAQPPQPVSPTADSAPKQGQSLTDFIEQLNNQDPKPEVRAWSQRAIDLAALNLVDADINLNTGALLYKQLKAGESAVSASVKSGVLTANLNKVTLYGGAGTGRVTVNGARTTPALALSFDLKNMEALPFLRDWIDFKWISGKANLVANLSGSGRTQQQIVSTLQGNGSLRFTDGAIEGVNIPAMIRGLKQGQFAGWKTNEREKTDFSALTGTFTVQNGVTSNGDLNLVGPLIRMTGAGRINLPAEQIDYSLTPRLVASLEGQGSDQQLGGLVIPVRVHGPLSDPKVVPDLQKIIDNPELAKDAIDKVGKAVKNLKGQKITGEQVEQLLQGVLGGGQQAQGEAGQQGQQVNPEDVLKQLFRKKQ